MASWILVPCLVSLRDEFTVLAPARDRSSDGSIGDDAHASSSSDHNPDETGATPSEDADSRNEVHAIDVDADLRKPGWSMAKAVEVIVTRHRDGRDNRLQNVIYNRRIWSRSWGWTARTYTGSNPHDKHAHFSSRYTTAQESDTRSWGLLEAGDESEGTMSVQDVRDFFYSAAKGVDSDEGTSATNRADREAAAKVVRYALGFNNTEQARPDFQAQLLPGQFARLGGAITSLDQVDEEAVAAAITPALVAAVEGLDGTVSAEDIERAVANVLRAGVDQAPA
jgi:hypothetical protein